MADMIKKQYLGGEKLKKKMLKPSEKFKFNFDWEAGDDTSKDLNPLYNNTHEAQLLFGRGLRAGVDRREQKKVSLLSCLCQFVCLAHCMCLLTAGTPDGVVNGMHMRLDVPAQYCGITKHCDMFLCVSNDLAVSI